ncbi:MAG: efflux transporter outer membrane subunit [Bacteroides sp.]|nr:efflux transporter outer membrane subunit [Bacteroides sp.]
MKVLTVSTLCRRRAVVIIALLYSCLMSGMQAQTPETISETASTIPGRWMYVPEKVQNLPPEDDWWKGFGDQLLDSLIGIAVERNHDLSIALRRVEIARRGVETARAGYYPTLNLSAGWNTQRTSGAMTRNVGPATTSSYMTAGASASWEIDVFGRVTAKVKQAKAGVGVSRADYAATMVTVCGDIASAYIRLRMYQAELALTREHLAKQERVLNIVKARHEAGLVSELDEAQAATVYGSTKAQLPTILNGITGEINTIATLLGMYPAEAANFLNPTGPLPAYNGEIRTVVPAELLRRRPDIIEAERTLAEQAAALGVSKKEFLPRLSIEGSVGFAAHDADELFKGHSMTYSVAPTLSWTLFDGFGRRAAVATAREQMNIASTQYEQTVLAAVTDVENALATYINATQLVDDLREVVNSAATFMGDAVEQYRSGLTNFTPVADAQISFLQYANNLIQARAQRLTSIIELYKAQGGGVDIE